MPKRLLSNSLLRGISDVLHETRMFASPHQLLASESRTLSPDSPIRFPNVWAPFQYLINMGLRPALARRLSSVYMDIVARYRQVFASYFRCAIRGSCHLNPEHYRDVYVVYFRSTIQVLASRIVSTAWVWLCRAGLHPTFLRSQHIDVRVNTSTKAYILSRLGLKTTSFIMDARSNIIELPEEECKTRVNFPTRTPTASVFPPLRSTAPSTCDLFHSEKPSTCFPAYYPPPPSKSISLHKETLLTQFELTLSAKDKPFANWNVDVSSLTAFFGKLSVSTSEAGLKTQENRKYARAPGYKMPEPSQPLSPVAASTSSSPRKPQSPNTEMVSPAKSVTKPRKRRIAALPKRQVKPTALPIIDPPLPPTARLPVSRTPSLISDTSSCSDSFSSSDELDTPPSTPPSHAPALIACNSPPTSLISSKSNTTGSFGFPMLTRAVFPDQRKEDGIHIDFTNGGAVGEQRFSFTFSA